MRCRIILFFAHVLTFSQKALCDLFDDACACVGVYETESYCGDTDVRRLDLSLNTLSRRVFPKLRLVSLSKCTSRSSSEVCRQTRAGVCCRLYHSELEWVDWVALPFSHRRCSGVWSPICALLGRLNASRRLLDHCAVSPLSKRFRCRRK